MNSVLFYDTKNGIPITENLEPYIQLEGFEPGRAAEIQGGSFLVPPLGWNKWDGHIYVSGATGSGKSFFINEMLLHDIKKRKVFLFSDLPNKDPSFEPMFKTGRLKMVRPEPFQKWETDINTFKRQVNNSIIVIDDCSNKEVLSMRDQALEKGRHRNVVVICVNHKLREHQATKKPLNESKYVIAFPSSNRGSVSNFMKDWFDLRLQERKKIMDVAVRDGRHVVFHMFSPNAVATTKSVIIV